MEKSFTIKQVVKGSRQEVYTSWSNPKLARAWAAPEGQKIKVFEADVSVGGSFRLKFTTAGDDISATGKYLEIVPDESVKYTWVWKVPNTEENLVCIAFHDLGPDTEVIVTVSGFSSPEKLDADRNYWAGSLAKLSKLSDVQVTYLNDLSQLLARSDDDRRR